MLMAPSQYAAIAGISARYVQQMAKSGRAETMPGITKCTEQHLKRKIYVLEVDEAYIAEKKAEKEVKPCQ